MQLVKARPVPLFLRFIYVPNIILLNKYNHKLDIYRSPSASPIELKNGSIKYSNTVL